MAQGRHAQRAASAPIDVISDGREGEADSICGSEATIDTESSHNSSTFSTSTCLYLPRHIPSLVRSLKYPVPDTFHIPPPIMVWDA